MDIENRDGRQEPVELPAFRDEKAAGTAKNKVVAEAVVRAVLFVLLALYLALFARMMFFRPGYLRPDAGTISWLEYARERTNFVPLRSTAQYISAIKSGIITPFEIAKNLLGNFFLFFPFGVILPLLFRFFRSIRRSAILFASVIAAAELIQLITMVGVCDIDDMILNYVGALAGFALAYLIIRWRKSVFLKETNGEIEKLYGQDK